MAPVPLPPGWTRVNEIDLCSILQVYLRKQKFKAKLKNRFKNCRRTVDNPVIGREREARGIQIRKRPSEGMPGMCPPYKKSKAEAAQEAARYSHILRHAIDETTKKSVLRESFLLWRNHLTRHSGRKKSQMLEMFPAMFTESAVSSFVNSNKTISTRSCYALFQRYFNAIGIGLIALSLYRDVFRSNLYMVSISVFSQPQPQPHASYFSWI